MDTVEVYTGGEIITCDSKTPVVAAMAVANGRVIAIGNREDVLERFSANAEVVDIDGRTIIPGLTDCHTHLAGSAVLNKTVECRDFYDPKIRSARDITDRLEAAAKASPEDAWLVATGSPMEEHRLVEGRFPTLEEFDRAVPNNPAYITFGAHVVLANSKALAAKHIDKSTSDPKGGHIERDPNTGAPNGLLLERARFLVQQNSTKHFTPEEMADSLEEEVLRCASRGVTAIHDILKYKDELTAWQTLRNQSRLPIRVMMLIRVIESEFPVDTLTNLGLTAGFGDDRLWFGGAKISIDGGFSSGSAAFTRDVSSNAGRSAIIRIDQDELDQTVKKYHDNGIRICVHAIGDLAADMTLSAFKSAGPARPELRHRVEHLGNFLFTSDRQEQARALGLTPVPNPSFLYFLGSNVWDLLGTNDARVAFPVKTALNSGFPLVSGSDASGQYWPVDVLRDIGTMVERKSIDDFEFDLSEALSPSEALRCQTVNAAWHGYREDVLGSLTPGKYADFVVLNCEHFDDRSGSEIRNTSVNRTVVGGKTIFRE